MALAINDRCTACAACLNVCPNQAIRPGRIFRINPWLCTECLGYSDEPQCEAVCPEAAIGAASQDPRRASSILR